MPISALARARAAEVFKTFQNSGAVAVEPNILQPAETLLDLYGESIRARAYVTEDPTSGEMMLRPDFTVPVVQMHMRDGTAEPARYTYMGDVFRKQKAGSALASEYLQVGYEVFDRAEPAAVDADVFVRIHEVLRDVDARPVMGDIGILTAAVRGLDISEPRRGALMRHIWRPQRFAALLERFSKAGLARRDVTPVKSPHIGLRKTAEIDARLAVLADDVTQTPLDRGQVLALNEILELNASATDALIALQEIAERMPAISDAVAGYAARLDALKRLGVDVETVAFEGSFGRTSLEYYDGFVFGFYVGETKSPLVASGGRYDALTRVLGQGRSIPAVGGVIWPEVLMQLEVTS